MKVRGQLHAPVALPPEKGPPAPETGWVPRTGLDVAARRKIPAPARNQTPFIQSIVCANHKNS